MNPLLSDMLQSFDYEPNQERFGSGQVRARYGDNTMTNGPRMPTQGLAPLENPMMGSLAGLQPYDPTGGSATGTPGLLSGLLPGRGRGGRFGSLGRFADDGYGGQNGMRPEMGQIQDRLSQMMQRWRR